MSQAVLHYFNGRGLAECIRLALTVADIEFREVNLMTRSEYLDLMPDLLFEQIPLLRIDGLNLVQSGAIVRYIAAKADLLGDNPQDTARINMLYDGSRDFLLFFKTFCFESNDDAVFKNIKEKAFPRYLPAFNKVLLESSSGYLVGSRLSLADLGLFEVLLATVDYFTDEPINEYPKLKSFYETIRTNDRVAKYISTVRKPKNDRAGVENAFKIITG